MVSEEYIAYFEYIIPFKKLSVGKIHQGSIYLIKLYNLLILDVLWYFLFFLELDRHDNNEKFLKRSMIFQNLHTGE